MDRREPDKCLFGYGGKGRNMVNFWRVGLEFFKEEMFMANIMKSPGKYIQGAGELAKIGTHVKKMGTNFLVIISKRNYGELGSLIGSSLEEAGYKARFEIFNGECSLEEIDRLTAIGSDAGVDSVIAVGGGKAIDTGKAVGVKLDVPAIIVPTIASNDAPCSGLSVCYNEKGVVCKVIYGKRNPDIVIVDTAIIAKSPLRLFVAGMGDAMSTYFEARACKASGAGNYCRGTMPNTAYAMAELCHTLLIKSGVQAYKDVQEGEASDAVDEIAEADILLSGVGFESCGLAAAHAINDGFAQVPQAHGALHGEKVAYGTLCQLYLENNQADFDEVYAFNKAVGLPTTLADLGITEVIPDEIAAVAAAACVKTQSTKNMPFPVSEADVVDAIMAVDKIGRERA